jgi:hypothetical protein
MRLNPREAKDLLGEDAAPYSAAIAAVANLASTGINVYEAKQQRDERKEAAAKTQAEKDKIEAALVKRIQKAVNADRNYFEALSKAIYERLSLEAAQQKGTPAMQAKLKAQYEKAKGLSDKAETLQTSANYDVPPEGKMRRLAWIKKTASEAAAAAQAKPEDRMANAKAEAGLAVFQKAAGVVLNPDTQQLEAPAEPPEPTGLNKRVAGMPVWGLGLAGLGLVAGITTIVAIRRHRK